MTATAIAESFVATSRSHLIEEYRPKIDRCLEELGDEGIWWRPNAESNAVGNLVLHTCGNARQWVASGILGQEDVRQRNAEFAAEAGVTVGDLRQHLTDEMAVIGGGLKELQAEASHNPGILQETRTIQGLKVTVQEALYHVVEHAAQHTGQIIYIAKLRSGKDLQFWVVDSGTARPNW